MSYSHQMERFILDKNSNNNKPSKIEVEDASFTEYVDEMNVGDYMRLGFEINPSNAEYSNVEIKSTNTGAIQVSGTKITAVAPGTATIMLYVDGKLYDQMKIVVPSDSTGGSTGGSSGGSTGGSDTDELEYAYFDDYQDTLFVGDTATLSYDIKPTSFLADVELESSDEDVIRVVSNYKYKAVGEGSAMLSLYVDGSLQDMILITVESDDYGEEEEELEHASISKYESELEVGQTAYAILDIEPKSYANQARLESSNERVIKISGNKYEAVGAGEAKITLYIGADRYDIIKVTVKGNGKEENTGTYDVTNIDEAYYQAIDFSPFTNEQLNVYKNSRVTGLKANGSSYSIDGYTFINGVNCASASTLWRELVLIDVNNPDVAHSYRMNLYGVKKGGFLTANKNINPTGRLNYSYATYNANFNKNSFKSYDKTRAGVPAGTYMLYVRVSDGKNGKMFPVQNLTLSDGSKTQLPSGFGMISSYDNVYWEVK